MPTLKTSLLATASCNRAATRTVLERIGQQVSRCIRRESVDVVVVDVDAVRADFAGSRLAQVETRQVLDIVYTLNLFNAIYRHSPSVSMCTFMTALLRINRDGDPFLCANDDVKAMNRIVDLYEDSKR